MQNLSRRFRRALGVDIADEHVGAGMGQRERHGVTDATVGTGARDHGDAIVEAEPLVELRPGH